MTLRTRLSRLTLIAATSAAFAVAAAPAAASPGDAGLDHRSDHAPGGATTQVDDHRPAGAGHGRKVG